MWSTGGGTKCKRTVHMWRTAGVVENQHTKTDGEFWRAIKDAPIDFNAEDWWAGKKLRHKHQWRIGGIKRVGTVANVGSGGATKTNLDMHMFGNKTAMLWSYVNSWGAAKKTG